MLRSFRVANHKSFRDEAELLLIPAYDKSRQAVPVAGIFGANASGKSNLIDALHWMRTAVRESLARWEPGSGIPSHPFQLAHSKEEPSSYEVEIVLEGVRYLYGFVVDSSVVREEWLHAYPHNRRRVIFERDHQQMAFGSTVSVGGPQSRLLSRSTRSNALFLTVAAHSDVAEVLAVYQWFRAGLLNLRVETASVAEGVLRRLMHDSPHRHILVELVRNADPDVRDIGLSQLPTDWLAPSGLAEVERKLRRLTFVHSSGKSLTVDDESDGTVSWLLLMSATLDVLTTGAVLLVDELDESLHSRIVAGFLDLFRFDDTNPRGAQVIFTTHDATLLSPVLVDEALRRDEIWFTEKREDGGSTLYPLSDFKPRKHENWERRYLTGNYGAVPLADEHGLHAPVEDLHRLGGERAAA